MGLYSNQINDRLYKNKQKNRETKEKREKKPSSMKIKG